MSLKLNSITKDEFGVLDFKLSVDTYIPDNLLEEVIQEEKNHISIKFLRDYLIKYSTVKDPNIFFIEALSTVIATHIVDEMLSKKGKEDIIQL
jgi:hypothetical protein